MSLAKRRRRVEVRELALRRDNGKCRKCGCCVGTAEPDGTICEGLDPHHITPREDMPRGGYVLSNIITLCGYCHEVAEAWLDDHPHVEGAEAAYSPSALYALIGTTYQRAVMEDQNL